MAAGDLDVTFGTGGVVTTTFPGVSVSAEAFAVVIQGDGKIVAAGLVQTTANDFALARYSTAGVIDSGFGTSGIVTTDFGTDDDSAQAVAIQPADQKIVAAGHTLTGGAAYDFAVARYTIAGSLDATFGTGGKVVTNLGTSDDEAFAVGIQGDGKIVVAGKTLTGESNYDFAIVRYSTAGVLDATFGTGGVVVTDFAGSNDSAAALAIQGDGKIIVVGQAASTSDSTATFAIARYGTSGTQDSGFGSSGLVTTSFGGDNADAALSVEIQGDGKILVCGRSLDLGTGAAKFAIARYSGTDGSLDGTFGSGGKVLTAFGSGNNDEAAGIGIQSGGKIVVGGLTTPSDQRFGLARYTTAGVLDSGFGTSGLVSTAIKSGGPATGLAVQSDSKIVLGGYAVDGAIADFALARYLGTSGSSTRTDHLPVLGCS